MSKKTDNQKDNEKDNESESTEPVDAPDATPTQSPATAPEESQIIREIVTNQSPPNPDLDDSVNDTYDLPNDDNGFDPDAHESDKEGNPVLNKDGSYRRKRGRKSEGKKSENFTRKATSRLNNAKDSTLQSGAGGYPLANPEQVRHNAKAFTGLLEIGGKLCFGDDGNYRNGEGEAIESAFVSYMEASGNIDLPPSVVLIVAIGGYAIPRVTKPERVSKIKLGWAWFKSKLKSKRKEKPKSKEEEIENYNIDKDAGRFTEFQA